eukprot:6203568-Pleurochrysis_carterae.AAC.1
MDGAEAPEVCGAPFTDVASHMPRTHHATRDARGSPAAAQARRTAEGAHASAKVRGILVFADG